MPVGLRQVVELVFARVHAAAAHGVDHWLPEMGDGFFDQCDLCLATFSERVAELGRKLEPCRPPPTITMRCDRLLRAAALSWQQ